MARQWRAAGSSAREARRREEEKRWRVSDSCHCWRSMLERWLSKHRHAARKMTTSAAAMDEPCAAAALQPRAEVSQAALRADLLNGAHRVDPIHLTVAASQGGLQKLQRSPSSPPSKVR